MTAHIGLTISHFDIDCSDLHLKGYSGEQLVELAAPAIREMAKNAASSAPASDSSPAGSSS